MNGQNGSGLRAISSDRRDRAVWQGGGAGESGYSVSVVVVVRSREFGAALIETCEGMNGTRVDVHLGRLRDIQPDIDTFRGADVLLLDVDPNDDEEVGELRSIVRDRFRDTPVVVAVSDTSIGGMRNLVRSGVADVVPRPVTRADLKLALEFAARSRQGDDSDNGGRIIALLKSGGGVGATTLAVQAGCILARRLGQGEPSKVCLLDLDVQAGNAGLYLDLENHVGLTDLLKSSNRLDGSLLRGAMARHECGLDILQGPREITPPETVPADAVEACLAVAGREYSYVLLDLPSIWTEWTIRALRRSDQIILITQLTVASLHQARRQLDALAASGLGEVPTEVVANRVASGWGRKGRLRDAAGALGRGIGCCIANDFETVSAALNRGVPFSKIARRSKVEKSICEVVDRVVVGGSGRVARAGSWLRHGMLR